MRKRYHQNLTSGAPSRNRGGHARLTIEMLEERQLLDGSNFLGPIGGTTGDYDLAVTALIAPAELPGGEQINVSWTVTNVGAAAVQLGWVDRITLGSPDDPNRLIIQFPVPDEETGAGLFLNPGISIQRTKTLTVPIGLAGEFTTLSVNTDSFNQVAETNEFNNVRSTQVRLGKPNLAITALHFPESVQQGDTFDVTWQVTNNGAATAPAGWVGSAALHVNAASDANPVALVYFSATNPLAPGESYQGRATFSLPANFSAPGLYFTVRSDTANIVGESTEGDNVATVALPLLAPDLFGTFTAPATAVVGGQFDLSLTITNQGTAPARADRIDLVVLSRDGVIDDNDVVVAGHDFANQTLAPGESSTVARQVLLDSRLEPGAWNLIFLVDVTGNQGESDETNNSLVLPITLEVPDLQITAAAAPAAAELGGQINLTWTVTNTSAVAAPRDWYDQVYLSTDDHLDDGDIFLAQHPVNVQTPLDSGAGYQLESHVALPADPRYLGQNYLLIVTDALQNQRESDEGNNQRAVAIDLSAPDLVVSNVASPSSATSGDEITVSWRITNQGTVAVAGWADHLILSRDAQAGGAIDLGTFVYNGTLAPGASVVRQQQVKIPRAESGNFHVHVITNEVPGPVEGSRDNNDGAAAQSLRVQLSPYPNLSVGNVATPNSVYSGQETEITWTTTNVGEAPTSAFNWFEDVWLSLDLTLDNSDIYLGAVANQSYLNPGESYANRATVRLPRGISGDYYYLVRTDTARQVDEMGRETDNVAAGPVTHVVLTPPADLQVASVRAPVETFSGLPVQVSWTVENRGPGATEEGNWTDLVFLSRTPTLGLDARFLGEVVRSGALASGASYTASVSVTVPMEASGAWYFVVKTDGFNQAYEYTFENDNVGFAACTVHLQPPPDLDVTRVEVPANALAGRSLSVRYQVANLGSVKTPNQDWSDTVYLCPTPDFDVFQAQLLGRVHHVGALEVNESYQTEVNFDIPNGLQGNFYVFVDADNGQQVFELDRDNNFDRSAGKVEIAARPADLVLAGLSGPHQVEAGKPLRLNWTVSNVGIGDTGTGSWSENIYASRDTAFDSGDLLLGYLGHDGLLNVGESYTATGDVTIPITLSGTVYLFVVADAGDRVYEMGDPANNVSAPLQLQVNRALVDLHVADVTVPTASVRAGDAVQIQYVVENIGDAVSAASFWYDSVYLTRDGTSILIGTVRRANPLAPGESYRVSKSFTIPTTLAGTYRVVVVADSQGHVFENDEANNSRHSGNGFEVIGSPAPRFDLAVEQVETPDAAVSGSPLSLRWTVTNNADPLSNLPVFDAVYLSLDQTFDPGSDLYLGAAESPTDVAAGASYSTSGTFKIPAGLSGLYYVLVATDVSNRLNEGTNERDNLSASANPVLITLQPPADLLAGTVTLPVTAQPGQHVIVQYTVSNAGDSAARGGWYDSLYLSRDDHWDARDAFLGRVFHEPEVAAGGAYSETLTARLPVVAPGAYRIIVRTDILNNLREAKENNNLSASLDQLAVEVPELVPGTSVTGRLSTGDFATYRIEIAEDAALLLNLDSQAPARTELYVRYGEPPTRGQFDFAYSSPQEADQQILVPVTKAGTYYVLAYLEAGPAATPFTLTAQTIGFSILDTNYGKGGTAGQRTIQINGAKFDASVQARLTNNTGFSLAATQVYYVNSSRVYATFDLTQTAPGTYDVVLENTLGQQARVADGLEVVKGGAGHLTLANQAPQSVRRTTNGQNGQFPFLVSWLNDGFTDIRAPYLKVESNSLIGLDPQDVAVGAFTIYGGGQGDSPAGILLPGQVGQRRGFALIDAGLAPVEIRTSVLGDGMLDDPFPWESAAEVRNATLRQGDDFTELVNQLRTQVGSRWRDYLDMLSRNANRVPAALSNPVNPADLLRWEVREAEAALATSISGKMRVDGGDMTLGGRVVRLTNRDTQETLNAYVLSDGSFAFTNLQAGSYRIELPGALISNPEAALVTLAAQQQVTGLAIKVNPGATLQVTVRDASQNTLAEAPVYLLVNDEVVAAGVTDSQGKFSFTGLVGSVTVVAQTSFDQSQAVAQVALSGAMNAVTMDLARGLRVVGRVMSGNQQPVNMATILVEREGGGIYSSVVAASLPDGTFVLQGLAEGRYQGTISRAGFADALIQFNLDPGQEEINLGDVYLHLPVAGAVVAQALPIAVPFAGGFFVYLARGARNYPYTVIEPTSPQDTQEKIDEQQAAIAALKEVYSERMIFPIYYFLLGPGASLITFYKDSDFAEITRGFLTGQSEMGLYSDGSVTVEEVFRDHPTTRARFEDAWRQAYAGFADLVASGQLSCDDFAGDGLSYGLADLINIHAQKTGEDLQHFYYVDGNTIGQKPDLVQKKWDFDADPRSRGTMVGGVGGGELQLPDSRPDSRRITGTVRAQIVGNSIILTPVDWKMTIEETFDFLPGNLAPINSTLGPIPVANPVRVTTVPLAFLEAHGVAKDAHFTIQFSNYDYSRFIPRDIPLPDKFKCKDDPDRHDHNDDNPGPGNDARRGGTSGAAALAISVTTKVASSDPNDILGPAGFGQERWVSAQETLPYTIRFENDPALANAPAQAVRITQKLDRDLDFRTFRVGDIGFGDVQIDVPDGRAFYQSRIDLTATKGFYLDVIAGVDVAKGEAFWDLRAIDPMTGVAPSDPRVGFLPPDVANGEGQGYVGYTVRARADVQTGARIDAKATIVFDVNPPIDTPSIFNTVDAGAPQTTAASSAEDRTATAAGSVLAQNESDASDASLFRISWSARDDEDGSAVASYTIYVSENGGPLRVRLQDATTTEALFDGVPGHRYEFYIAARDLAGNVEALRDRPDVVVQLAGDDGVAPTSSVRGLPTVSRPRFLVTWAGVDDPAGSGLDTFDVFVSSDGGAFQPWLRQTHATSAYYNGQAGHRYAFASVARDRAGNVEALPARADATTLISGSLNGVIAGQFFLDTDGSGTWEDGEVALTGWHVFLDGNGNARRDADEVEVQTDETGSFAFANVAPGTYAVTPIIPAGWVLTAAGTLAPATSAAALYAAAEGGLSTPAGGDPLALIGMEQLRSDPRFAGIDGHGLNVAVLDAGIDAASPLFGPDTIVAQIDFTQGTGAVAGVTDHGTSVAQLLAGRDGGVVPGAGLIDLKVMDAAGRGTFANVEHALQWLVAHAAEYHVVAVNLSFGDLGHYNTAVGLYGLGDELAALSRQGVILVAAAGNDYGAGGGLPYPAADPNILAVGAVYPAALGGPFDWRPGVRDNTSGTDRLAAFSQRDDRTVFAPGVQIMGVGADGKMLALSGTSFATPYVTGAAVLAQQLAQERLGRSLTPDEFRRLVVGSGVTIHDGDDEDDSVTNTGRDYVRLDAYGLLQAVLRMPERAPAGDPSTPPLAGALAPSSLSSLQTLPAAITVTVGTGETIDALRFGFRGQPMATTPRTSTPVALAPQTNLVIAESTSVEMSPSATVVMQISAAPTLAAIQSGTAVVSPASAAKLTTLVVPNPSAALSSTIGVGGVSDREVDEAVQSRIGAAIRREVENALWQFLGGALPWLHAPHSAGEEPDPVPENREPPPGGEEATSINLLDTVFAQHNPGTRYFDEKRTVGAENEEILPATDGARADRPVADACWILAGLTGLCARALQPVLPASVHGTRSAHARRLPHPYLSA